MSNAFPRNRCKNISSGSRAFSKKGFGRQQTTLLSSKIVLVPVTGQSLAGRLYSGGF